MAGGLVQDGVMGFLGVNLRRDRLALADGEMAKAINADLHSVLGAAIMRLGSARQNTTAFSELIVRTIARVNGQRYRAVGQSLFWESTNLTKTLSGRNTTIAGMRPLNDSAIWAFVADDSVMRKASYSTLRRWGINAPETAASLIAGVQTGLTGGYVARYTYIRYDGLAVAHEGNPSPVASLSLSGNDLVLYEMIDPTSDQQINGIGVYRSVAGGQDGLLVGRHRIPALEEAYGLSQGWEASALAPNSLRRVFTQPANVTTAATSATGGPLYAGSALNLTTIGSNAWNATSRATGAGDGKESYSTNTATSVSNYLVLKTFGFAVPATATILGIQVDILRRTGTGVAARDNAIRIVKGSAVGSTDRSVTTDWPAAFGWATYGGSSDLWGLTWTPSDINSSGFGAAISAKTAGGSGRADVDAVRITVYTGAGASTQSLRVLHSWEPDGTGNSEDSAGRRCSQLWEQLAGYSTRQTNTWAYADATADLALGAIVETDNNPPPVASFAVPHAEHMFLVRDTSNPHYLWWSKRFRPESFPVSNFLEIGTAADPLQALASYAGFLGAFSRLTKYLITGNATSGFFHTEMISRRGTTSPYSVVPTELGVTFLHRSGVYLTTLIEADKEISADILPLFSGETVNGLSPINWAEAEKVSATAYKRRLYLSYPSGTSTEPDMVMVYSADTAKWYFYQRSLRALYFEEDTDSLLGGGQDGFVYVLESGSDDAGTAIALDLETKDFHGVAGPTIRKSFRYLKVDADCDDASLTAAFIVDGATVATKTITGNRTKALLPLPGTMGYSWRVKITYTGTKQPRIYGVACLYLPLENG